MLLKKGKKKKINWPQARVLQLESKAAYSKYNKMLTLYIATILLVSQVWLLLIRKEIKCD